LASQEVHDITVALGVDPGSADLTGLRYGKVCILADADSDGLIRDAILGGAPGRLYMWMNLYKETPPTGFTYGAYDFDPDTAV
jgi:hypothetical protein